MKNLEEIRNYLANGIMVDGELRKFDLIDLYLMYGAQSAGAYLRRNAILDKSLGFAAKNREALLNMKITLGPTKDERGNTIPGRTITMEEKEAIVAFLDENNIPCSDPLFMTALRKYLRGELELNVNRSLA